MVATTTYTASAFFLHSIVFNSFNISALHSFCMIFSFSILYCTKSAAARTGKNNLWKISAENSEETSRISAFSRSFGKCDMGSQPAVLGQKLTFVGRPPIFKGAFTLSPRALSQAAWLFTDSGVTSRTNRQLIASESKQLSLNRQQEKVVNLPAMFPDLNESNGQARGQT